MPRYISPLIAGSALWNYYQPVKPLWHTTLISIPARSDSAAQAAMPITFTESSYQSAKPIVDFNFTEAPVYPYSSNQSSANESAINQASINQSSTNQSTNTPNDALNHASNHAPNHVLAVPANRAAIIIPIILKPDMTCENILALVYRIRKTIEDNPSHKISIRCNKENKKFILSIMAAYTAIFSQQNSTKYNTQYNTHGNNAPTHTKYHTHDLPFIGNNTTATWDEVKKSTQTLIVQQTINLHRNLTTDLKNAKKSLTLENYIDEFNEYNEKRIWAKDPTPSGANALSSLEFKNQLKEQVAFAQLQLLTSDNTLATPYKTIIQHILRDIYLAKDDSPSWLARVLSYIQKKKTYLNASEKKLFDNLRQLTQFAQQFQATYSPPQEIQSANHNNRSNHYTLSKTWQRVNSFIRAAGQLQDKLLTSDWSHSSRTLHQVKYTDKQVSIPTPIKTILNKFDRSLHHYHADNTMETALKRAIATALLESNSTKNSQIERDFFERFSTLINFEKTFENIIHQIDKSRFSPFGIGPHATIFGNKVPTNIAKIYRSCHLTPKIMGKGNIGKLIAILEHAKHCAEADMIARLCRRQATHEFYKNIEQCLVLKNTSELEHAIEQITVSPSQRNDYAPQTFFNS